jgi:hypothetical protein
MEQKIKETYWSRFPSEFEERQSRVVGNEILFLMKKELLKENNLGNALELGCEPDCLPNPCRKFQQ